MTDQERQALLASERLVAEMRSMLAFCCDERSWLLDMISNCADPSLISAVANHMRRAPARLDAAFRCGMRLH